VTFNLIFKIFCQTGPEMAIKTPEARPYKLNSEIITNEKVTKM